MIKRVFILSNGEWKIYYAEYESGYFRRFESVTGTIKRFLENAKNCETTHCYGGVNEYEFTK